MDTHDTHPHIRRNSDEGQEEGAYLEVPKQKVAGKIAVGVL